MPVELPVGHDRPLTLRQELQRYVRYELSREKEAEGFESFEEADDFEPEDSEKDWASQYELTELQEEEPLPIDVVDEEGGVDSPPQFSPEDNSQPAQGGTPETPASEPAAQQTGTPDQPVS